MDIVGREVLRADNHDAADIVCDESERSSPRCAHAPDIPSGKYLGRLLGGQLANEPNFHPLLCLRRLDLNCAAISAKGSGTNAHPRSSHQDTAASAAIAVHVYHQVAVFFLVFPNSSPAAARDLATATVCE